MNAIVDTLNSFSCFVTQCPPRMQFFTIPFLQMTKTIDFLALVSFFLRTNFFKESSRVGRSKKNIGSIFCFQSLTKESQNFETRHRDVLVLSKNVVDYVGTDAPATKSEIDDNVKTLTERYQK